MGAAHVSIGFVELQNGARLRRFDFAPADIDDAQARIEESVAQILMGRFEHLARLDALVCTECPALGNLCPVDGPAITRSAV